MIFRIYPIHALIALCSLFTWPVYAQLPDYHVQLFDERYGLRTDMERVLKDKTGFIWLMYADRVQRFDGEDIEEFSIKDRLNSIFCDRDNKLWLTSRSQVYLFDVVKQEFRPVEIDTTAKPTIAAVFQWGNQKICVLTDRGIYTPDQKWEKFLPVTDAEWMIETPVNIRRNCHSLFNNKLFFQSRDTIWAHDLTTGQKQYLPGSNVSSLAALNKNQLILTNWKSQTFLYDFEKHTIQRIFPNEFLDNSLNDFLFINSVLNLDLHIHLLATSKGLLQFNSLSGELSPKQLFFKGQLLKNGSRITNLHLDNKKKIWACSEYNLMTFDPFVDGMGLIRNPEEDPSTSFGNHIRNFAADEKENLWLATYNGIAYWDIQQNSFQSFFAVEGAPDRMNHPSIRGLAYDGKNVLIGQTNRGIWLYNPVKKEYQRPVYEPDESGESTRIKLEKDFIDQIYKLHNGNHFIAARDGGYVIEANTYLIRQVSFPGSKENLNFCYEDKDHQVWVGTHEGLYCLDSNLVFKFAVNEGLASGLVRCLYQWDEQEYILGKSGLFGLRMVNGKIETRVLNHFFDNIIINSLFRDHADRLWLGTDEGLYCYDRKTEQIETFDLFDNIQGDNYFPNCLYENSSGVLFMGGTNGINYFHPDKVIFRQDSLMVSIMKIRVNQDDSSFHNRASLLTLKPHENSIEIEYVAPYFGNTNRLLYRYQLEGFNTAWQNVGGNNNVRFTSLPSGQYNFVVAASMNGVDWYESKESLIFNIAFPFWRTQWFIISMIMGLGGMLAYFIRKRINSIQQKEKVKRDYERRIAEVEMHALRAQMNPHFMFNSLNSINNFILKNDPDNASGYLTKFSRLMRLILDNSRSEWVLLENELKALEIYIELEMVRFDHVFEYEIDLDPNVKVNTISIPPMIIQPYVENAIWHGLMHRKDPGGKLCIRLWRETGQLHIRIEDNGVGREEAKRLKSKSATKHKSHGMKITEERIAIVNRIYNVKAKVVIEDLAGHNGSNYGTRVSLTLQDKIYESHHSG